MAFSMDEKKFVKKFSLTNPVGHGGCRNEGNNFDCCEYNLTVFDNKLEQDSIIDFEGEVVKLHHGSMKETHPEVLTQYQNMKIISDDQWELRIFLNTIKEKKEKIFNAYTKSCLIEAAVCATKTKDGIKNSDPFASCWVKCASYFIADAIFLSNFKRPSPTHMLESIRGFEKNKINENFSIVNECIGIERATSSLLLRMCKSTIGFSDMVEKNNHSKIIQKKYDYFVNNSLMSDCYFYLGYINRNNFIKIRETLHRNPDYIYVLKIAFDVDNDINKIENQANTLHKTANELLLLLKK